MSNAPELPVVGISLGDVNGIGPEVIIKTFNDNRLMRMVTPVVYGSTKILSYYRKALNLKDFNYFQLKGGTEPNPRKLNVINCWEETVNITMGQETPEGGAYAFKSLEAAVSDLKENKIQALVTAPINKNNIQSDDFKFPGHTEYLTENFGANDSLMLLVSDNLRIGTVTGHIPLHEVSNQLTRDKVASKLKILLKSLKEDFGILKPRVAVLGLNPHAGENGLLGTEETQIIAPVVNELKDKGHLVFGPYPADGFFGNRQEEKFDAVLAMYHDQGLIPFKALAFNKGVNYTAGLPIIRTSPDHGTAYDITGKDLADESSFREAIYLALDIWKNRQELEK